MAKKIAIVEDDAAIAQMYLMKFEADGYDAQVAPDGKQGLQLIKTLKPDIVLLDLMMPEMTGDEVLKELRKTDWGKDIKVIILTNMGEQEVTPEVRKLGVVSVVLKADMTPQQVSDLVKQSLS